MAYQCCSPLLWVFQDGEESQSSNSIPQNLQSGILSSELPHLPAELQYHISHMSYYVCRLPLIPLCFFYFPCCTFDFKDHLFQGSLGVHLAIIVCTVFLTIFFKNVVLLEFFVIKGPEVSG
jgi:hypothetical protein